jgi:nucleoside-diphosphate-sugar epimerase
MRVAIIGGTRFIGFSVTVAVHAAGHDVLIVHRGATEPPELRGLEHLHVDRNELGDRLRAWEPDAVIDTYAMTGGDAAGVLAAAPPEVRLVAVSSADVYRAHGSLHAGLVTDALPLDETAPLRDRPLPYARDGYEKIDVERAYLSRGATVCRLAAVYGPRDPQRREGPVIDRVAQGDRAIPVGSGNLLWSKAFVDDVGEGVRLALEADVAGEVFNLAEHRTVSMAQWYGWILEDLGTDVRLERVPGNQLPLDLATTGFFGQHVLVDASKAREVLGWTETDPREALLRSVRWHVAQEAEPLSIP